MGFWCEICNDFELSVKEDKQVKVNYKPAMTEEELRGKLADLFSEVRDKARVTTAGYGACGTWEYADKAMDICRNDPQEVESVEIETQINVTETMRDPFNRCKVRIPIETIKEINKAIGL